MINKNIFEKINKLLALANSSNENETTVAAQKASLLLAQYNLSLADLGSQDLTDITELVVETTTRFISWKMLLLGGIAEANGCQAFRNNYNGNMRLIGSHASLIVCQNMYEYLSKTLLATCQVSPRKRTRLPQCFPSWMCNQIKSKTSKTKSRN